MKALREFESKNLIRIGGYTVSVLGRDQQNIDEESETFLVTWERGERGSSGSIPFSSYEDAKAYAYKRAGVIDPDAATEAPANPIWQMDVRQRLDLKPGQNDPVSMLLWAAIYGSSDEAEVCERLESHVEELRRAIAVLEAGAK